MIDYYEDDNYIVEMLTYSNYRISKRQKSKIDPDMSISVDIAMKCPRCKTTLPLMDHGSKQTCSWCNLEMVLHGNGLTCKAQKNESSSWLRKLLPGKN